jgi:hypothetical protein
MRREGQKKSAADNRVDFPPEEDRKIIPVFGNQLIISIILDRKETDGNRD